MELQSKDIKIILGLGNPGTEYANTYHNAGALFADFLAADKDNSRKKKIVRNSGFINEAGTAAKKVLAEKKVKPEMMAVAHDDSDILIGRFKFSFGRGPAGHKGASDIIKKLETKDFWRIRIGIRPRPAVEQKKTYRLKAGDFVLKKIKAGDKKILAGVFREIAEKIQNER